MSQQAAQTMSVDAVIITQHFLSDESGSTFLRLKLAEDDIICLPLFLEPPGHISLVIVFNSMTMAAIRGFKFQVNGKR